MSRAYAKAVSSEHDVVPSRVQTERSAFARYENTHFYAHTWVWMRVV